MVAGRVDFLDRCQTTRGRRRVRQFKNNLPCKGRDQINAIEHVGLERAGWGRAVIDITTGTRHAVIVADPPCRAVRYQRHRVVLLEQNKIAAVGAGAVLFLDRDRIVAQIVFLERDPASASSPGVRKDYVIRKVKRAEKVVTCPARWCQFQS